MVFPSLMFRIEPGFISQLSAWSVMAFSFMLYRFKKLMIFATALMIVVLLFCNRVFAFGLAPSNNYNNFPNYNYGYNNMNYYGRPWGYSPPTYFYPQLPYHSLYGPQQYYFQPHNYSPYAPVDCPYCNQNQQQAPSFPIHPGGGVS